MTVKEARRVVKSKKPIFGDAEFVEADKILIRLEECKKELEPFLDRNGEFDLTATLEWYDGEFPDDIIAAAYQDVRRNKPASHQ
jgi:hypothetical protein